MARSITDDEIGLIKAMLLRGMKNRDIQFYFNRPDRPVNSGRITGIRQGSYGTAVAAATDSALDHFIATFSVDAKRGVSSAQPPPSDDQRVLALFSKAKLDGWRLAGGETDEVECKREVEVKKLAPVVRAIAGMANNKGGLILLGVENLSGKVVGLRDDQFAKLDLVKLTLAVKAHLQPTPSFRKGTIEIGGVQVGYVCVEPCIDKPVIVYRPGDRLDDGAILFRYPAETAPAKFGDLRTLLEERDARRLRALVDVTSKIAEIGLENSAVLNMADGALKIGEHPMQLDQALLDQIKFIKEGRFDEVAGAPTLRLMGEISVVGGAKLPSGRRLITDEDVLRNFLDQEPVLEPLEYIRFAVAGSRRGWAPIFFFGKLAGLSRQELLLLIGQVETARVNAREKVVRRALGKQTAYAKHVGTPAKRLKAILDGDRTPPSDAKDASNTALALQGLADLLPPKEDMLSLLKACASKLIEANELTAMSNVYRAAGRLDEVYFGNAI